MKSLFHNMTLFSTKDKIFITMEITNWKNRDIINHLITRKCILQKDLAKDIYNLLGRDYSPHSLSGKIHRNAIKLEELQAACKLLGYRLILEEIEEP